MSKITRTFGFASYQDRSFELIVRDEATSKEVTLHGTLQPEQTIDAIDMVLPTCVYVEAVNADEVHRLRALLSDLVNAKALIEVRKTVAGWLGEGRADGPYEHRHPYNLGARIDTRCGPMYELDEIMQRVRAHLTQG